LQREKGELSAHQFISIEDADSIFENSPTKVVANRNEEKVELPGLKVGPFEEGVEYELRFWVASELQKAGVVRFREEDTLDVVKLHRVHWKERVQPTSRVSPLPHDFYPRLRRYLTSLIRASEKDRERLKEQEKTARISNDLVNCRVRKIVSLASAPPLAEQALKGLTTEERSLYRRLNTIINEWRSRILKL
jgi:hypothetical protein